MKFSLIILLIFLASCAIQVKFQEVDSKKEVLERAISVGDTITFITTNKEAVTIKVKEITNSAVIGEADEISFKNIETYYFIPKKQQERGSPTTEAWWYIGAILIWLTILN
jgi:hypothetical protein